MKKALIIIGVFLLIQFGVALTMLVIGQAGGIDGITMGDGGNIKLSPTFQLMTVAISSLCSIIAILAVCHEGVMKPFRLGMPIMRGLSTIGLSALAVIPLAVLISELSFLIGIPDNLATMFKDMANHTYAIPVLVFAGPLAEELCFRYGIAGSLLRGQKKGGSIWVPILVSAVMFGIIHFNPAQSVAAIIIGVYFGWLYVKSGSIWPSLVCHMINNFASILLLRQGAENASIRQSISNDIIYWLIIAGVVMLVVLSLWAISRTIKRH